MYSILVIVVFFADFVWSQNNLQRDSRDDLDVINKDLLLLQINDTDSTQRRPNLPSIASVDEKSRRTSKLPKYKVKKTRFMKKPIHMRNIPWQQHYDDKLYHEKYFKAPKRYKKRKQKKIRSRTEINEKKGLEYNLDDHFYHSPKKRSQYHRKHPKKKIRRRERKKRKQNLPRRSFSQEDDGTNISDLLGYNHMQNSSSPKSSHLYNIQEIRERYGRTRRRKRPYSPKLLKQEFSLINDQKSHKLENDNNQEHNLRGPKSRHAYDSTIPTQTLQRRRRERRLPLPEFFRKNFVSHKEKRVLRTYPKTGNSRHRGRLSQSLLGSSSTSNNQPTRNYINIVNSRPRQSVQFSNIIKYIPNNSYENSISDPRDSTPDSGDTENSPIYSDPYNSLSSDSEYHHYYSSDVDIKPLNSEDYVSDTFLTEKNHPRGEYLTSEEHSSDDTYTHENHSKVVYRNDEDFSSDDYLAAKGQSKYIHRTGKSKLFDYNLTGEVQSSDGYLTGKDYSSDDYFSSGVITSDTDDAAATSVNGSVRNLPLSSSTYSDIKDDVDRNMTESSVSDTTLNFFSKTKFENYTKMKRKYIGSTIIQRPRKLTIEVLSILIILTNH